MAFTPATGIAEVRMKYGATGGPQYNIYHVHHTDGSAWNNTQLSALVGVFAAWEAATALSKRHNVIFWIEGFARDLTTEFGAEAQNAGAVQGTAPGAALPANVTLAVKAVTGVAGRSRRGRTYWIGLSESMTQNDSIIAPYLTSIPAALETLRTSINAVANQEMVVLSAQENNVKLNPRVGRVITGWALADTNLDSQRRRLTGHNVHR